MQTIPTERWFSLCAELSSQFLGCLSTIETVRAEDDPELLIAEQPFGGLRLESAGDTVRITALVGSQTICVAERPVEITLADLPAGAGQIITFHVGGLLSTRIILASDGYSSLSRGVVGCKLPLRERAVSLSLPG
ncbi:MAG: hypothetical protein HGA45_19130 [Chloroflexales bacterium]|nr:hypothetical protein [Chloroflexales bacterium]